MDQRLISGNNPQQLPARSVFQKTIMGLHFRYLRELLTGFRGDTEIFDDLKHSSHEISKLFHNKWARIWVKFLSNTLDGANFAIDKIWPVFLFFALNYDGVRYAQYPNDRFGTTPSDTVLGTSDNYSSLRSNLLSDMWQESSFQMGFYFITLGPLLLGLTHAVIQQKFGASLRASDSKDIIDEQSSGKEDLNAMIDAITTPYLSSGDDADNQLQKAVLKTIDVIHQLTTLSSRIKYMKLAMNSIIWDARLTSRAKEGLVNEIVNVLFDPINETIARLYAAKVLANIAASYHLPASQVKIKNTAYAALTAYFDDDIARFSNSDDSEAAERVEVVEFPINNRSQTAETKYIKRMLTTYVAYLLFNRGWLPFKDNKINVGVFTTLMSYWVLATIAYWAMFIRKSRQANNYFDQKADCESRHGKFNYANQAGNNVCQVATWSFLTFPETLNAHLALEKLIRQPQPLNTLNKRLQHLHHFGPYHNITLDFSTFDWNEFDKPDLDKLFAMIKAVPYANGQVKALNFALPVGNGLVPSAELMQHIVSLCQQTKPHFLLFTHFNLQGHGEAIANCLHAGLQQLNLAGCDLKDNDLLPVLRNSTHVDQLHLLTNNNLLTTFVLDEAPSYLNQSGLVAWNLANNAGLTGDGIGKLINTTKMVNNQLHYLDATAAAFSLTDGEQFAKQIKGSTITDLNIANCGVDIFFLAATAPIFAQQLRYLGLSDNSLNTDAAGLVFDALTDNGTLTEIDLANNRIDDDISEYLTEAKISVYLSNNRLTANFLFQLTEDIALLNIRGLDLSYNQFSGDLTEPLNKLWQNNTGPNYFACNSCGLSATSMRTILMSQNKKLSLTNNIITDSADLTESFNQALHRCEYLDLSNNNIVLNQIDVEDAQIATLNIANTLTTQATLIDLAVNSLTGAANLKRLANNDISIDQRRNWFEQAKPVNAFMEFNISGIPLTRKAINALTRASDYGAWQDGQRLIMDAASQQSQASFANAQKGISPDGNSLDNIMVQLFLIATLLLMLKPAVRLVSHYVGKARDCFFTQPQIALSGSNNTSEISEFKV